MKFKNLEERLTVDWMTTDTSGNPFGLWKKIKMDLLEIIPNPILSSLLPRPYNSVPLSRGFIKL